MLQRAILFMSVLLMGGQVMAASVCQKSWGQVVCGAGSVAQLQAEGQVTMIGTVVKGPSQIQGTLNANHVRLNQLKVQGMTVLSHGAVLGEGHIVGGLVADHCQFHKALTLVSQTAQFTDCQVPQLNVVVSSGVSSVIQLKGQSQVGKIVFSSPGGTVWVFDHARVLAPVIGGKVVQK